MILTRPKTKADKPTAWLKQLDLRSGNEYHIAQATAIRDINFARSDNHVAYKTEHVNKSVIKRFKKYLKPLTDKQPQKLNIMPIGGICQCHSNADEAVDMLNQMKILGCPFTFRKAVGYNLSTCKCGTDLFGEVHSVLYCVEKNEYYDITEDMFWETEKWFVEVDSMTENYAELAREGHRDFDMICNRVKGCKSCRIKHIAEHQYNNPDLTSAYVFFNKVERRFAILQSIADESQHSKKCTIN